jgi:hypothetical protein
MTLGGRRASLEQILNAPVVLNRGPGPQRSVGPRGNGEQYIVVAQPGQAAGRALGLGRNQVAAWIEETPSMGAGGGGSAGRIIRLDAKTTFMDQSMMGAAQQHQVVQRGCATVDPVFNMVPVRKVPVGAARKSAGAIA